MGAKKTRCNLSKKSSHRDIKSKEEVVAPVVKCLLSRLALNWYLFSDERTLSLGPVPQRGGSGAPEVAQSFPPNHVCIRIWSLTKLKRVVGAHQHSRVAGRDV